MAFKIISGGLKQPGVAQQQQALPVAQEQQPGFLSSLGGSLGQLGTSLGIGVAKIPTSIADLALSIPQAYTSETGEIKTTRPSEMHPQLTEKVHALGESVKQKFPTSFPAQEALNKVAEALPAFYAPGGGFAHGLSRAITRAIGSETGRFLAKGAGYGELGQFLGSTLGAGLAAGLLTNRDLGKIESLSYRDFEKSIPKDAKTALTNAKESYDSALKQRLLPGASKWLKENLGDVEAVIKSGSTATRSAYDDMKHINRIIREEVPSITSKGVRDEVKKILQGISTSIKQDIIDSAKDNPGLNAQALINGSSISYARNNQPLVRRIIKLAGGPTGLAGTGIGVLAGRSLIGKAALPIGAAALGAKGFIEPALIAAKSPAARQEILGRTIPQTLSGILAGLK